MNRPVTNLPRRDHNPQNTLFKRETEQNPVPDRQNRLRKFILLQTKSAMTKDVLTIGPQMTLRELEHLFETPRGHLTGSPQGASPP